MAIKNNYLIEKRNVLNEIRANNMTLQELRFFSIYLAKINSRDVATRVVRFPIEEFRKIMELGRLKIDYLKNVTNGLLCKVVNAPKENGGYTAFQLFKECSVDMDENNEWYIEIEAHDKALPLMFEFKERYFTYELWNALRLGSSNQLRMYEILKQYEKVGERIVSIDELKELLGIEKKEYPRYDNFKVRVLDSCQKALVECTDIKFTYEPTGKRGKGGKIIDLKFTIIKNTSYTDQLSLLDFIQAQGSEDNAEDEASVVTLEESTFKDERLEFLAEACNSEFTETEMQMLYNLIIKIMPYRSDKNNQIEWYDYLKRKYDEMLWRSERTKISNRFGYLKKIIEADLTI